MKRLFLLVAVVFLAGTISCKKEAKKDQNSQEQQKVHITQKHVMDVDLVLLGSKLMEKYGRNKVEAVTIPAGVKLGENYAASEFKGIFINGKLHLPGNGSFKISKAKTVKTKLMHQRKFPSVWLAKDLRPYALQYEFSLWLHELPFQQIERFDDKHGYDFWLQPNDKVIVKPKPQCIVLYDGVEYIIGYDNSIWLTRRQSHLRRGEPFNPERLK